MVKFINSVTPEPSNLLPIKGVLAKPFDNEGCAGPCHGLSANAMFAPPCRDCPCKKELAHG